MLIEASGTLAEFERLRPEWEALYQADPQAHVFVSWPWLRGWLEAARPAWHVLAARPAAGAPASALLFLRARTARRGRWHVDRELYLGGKPHADYAGFLCRPGEEAAALPALARHLQQHLAWDRLHLDDVLDPRLAAFAGEFAGQAYHRPEGRLACPYLDLPATWERYLEERLSAKARKHLRYYMRKVEALPGFRATQAEPATLEAHLDALLPFWQARWGRDPEGNRRLLRHCFAQGCLWLGGLWQAETPVALLAAFVDEPKQTFAYYLSGFNPAFAELSPGRVMVGHSLRYAIEHGFRLFDFLRGDEDYKLTYGTAERFVESWRVERPTSRNTLLNVMDRVARRMQSAGAR
ncbi:MAG: GNAT family N-acetyltransferase [Anaerolineales bacterium]|nr:GNAT family N-acetyltransferase [Anaerolineales bacterium]